MAAQELEKWLRAQPGSYLHANVHIVSDAERGLHWHSDADIKEGTKILTVPHCASLSYLNALVDDKYPVFKTRRQEFKIEAIGFFYLMLQYVKRDTSYWKPYLDTLPPPDSELSTALWFDNSADAAWLKDTDTEHTMAQRTKIYQSYYESGIDILSSAGVDTSQLTWNLFRWSITMFTSRSFPSRSIAPHESRYWTTYKTGAQGQRQAVLLDMQNTAAEDLDFSVLFPGMDAGNHDLAAKVHWDFDPGRFSLTTMQDLSAGQEINNNYGSKANDELLQGYGFCIENNPYDVVLLTLKAPEEKLQLQLRTSHSGYFDASGYWQPDKATFRLCRLPPNADTSNLLDFLPESLLDLLMHIIRYDLGISAAENQDDTINEVERRWYTPHVLRIILASMSAKAQKLSATTPDFNPTRAKHRYGRTYRQSQIDISTSYAHALQASLASLVLKDATTRQAGPDLITLATALQQLRKSSPSIADDFLTGIEVNANTSDIDSLMAAGWEDDIWVLLFTFSWIASQNQQQNPIFPWATPMLRRLEISESPTNLGELDDQAAGMLELVKNAAEALPESMWSDERWSAVLTASIGGRMLRDLSFTIPVKIGDSLKIGLFVHI